MAEPEQEIPPVADNHDEEDGKHGYKAPAQKAMTDIVNLDKEDESLNKYKQQLLGSVENVIFFPEDPRRVLVNKLAFVTPGRPDIELDLTQDLNELKKKKIVIKENCNYHLKIYFYVQREIVAGLRYIQKTSRKGIQVDKTNVMMGSYGPKSELHSYNTAQETAPSGMLYRGDYKVHSLFTDDDKNKHLEWEWMFEIKKDWN